MSNKHLTVYTTVEADQEPDDDWKDVYVWTDEEAARDNAECGGHKLYRVTAAVISADLIWSPPRDIPPPDYRDYEIILRDFAQRQSWTPSDQRELLIRFIVNENVAGAVPTAAAFREFLEHIALTDNEWK